MIVDILLDIAENYKFIEYGIKNRIYMLIYISKSFQSKWWL